MRKPGKNTFAIVAVVLLIGAGPAPPAITFTKATKADQKAVAAQKVCKVSGKALDSMGGPLKATRGDRSVFLCCADCEKAVLAEPDRYFALVLTTVKAGKADRKAVAAQKVCPVSGEALDSMGGPVKVSDGARSVFLCCKACLKNVQADPEKYLGKPAAAPAVKGSADRPK